MKVVPISKPRYHWNRLVRVVKKKFEKPPVRFIGARSHNFSVATNLVYPEQCDIPAVLCINPGDRGFFPASNLSEAIKLAEWFLEHEENLEVQAYLDKCLRERDRRVVLKTMV